MWGNKTLILLLSAIAVINVSIKCSQGSNNHRFGFSHGTLGKSSGINSARYYGYQSQRGGTSQGSPISHGQAASQAASQGASQGASQRAYTSQGTSRAQGQTQSARTRASISSGNVRASSNAYAYGGMASGRGHGSYSSRTGVTDPHTHRTSFMRQSAKVEIPSFGEIKETTLRQNIEMQQETEFGLIDSMSRLQLKYQNIIENNYQIPLKDHDAMLFEMGILPSIQLPSIDMNNNNIDNWIKLDTNNEPMFEIVESRMHTTSFGYEKDFIVNAIYKDGNNQINASPLFILPFKLAHSNDDIFGGDFNNHYLTRLPIGDTTNIKTKIACENYGNIIFMYGFYSASMLEYIDAIYNDNMNHAPKILFGDNDSDKYRNGNELRGAFGGQASVFSKFKTKHFDQIYGYGITTTFFNQERPQLDAFKILMDNEFKLLEKHIQLGNDIIIPSPNDMELKQNPSKYFDEKTGKQVIFHNLGTGIANLPMEYLLYIQEKIDQLILYYGSPIKTIDISSKYYPFSNQLLAFKDKIQEKRLVLPQWLESKQEIENEFSEKERVPRIMQRLGDEYWYIFDEKSPNAPYGLFPFVNKNYMQLIESGQFKFTNKLLTLDELNNIFENIIGTKQFEIVPNGLANFIDIFILNELNSIAYESNKCNFIKQRLKLLNQSLFTVKDISESMDGMIEAYNDNDFIQLTDLLAIENQELKCNTLKFLDSLSNSLRNAYHGWLTRAIESNLHLQYGFRMSGSADALQTINQIMDQSLFWRDFNQ